MAGRLPLRRLDRQGAIAVEFALLTPVFAILLLGVIEVGALMFQRTDMHGAVRTGSQYVLNGGRDLDTARAIVMRSWTTRPEDGVVEATRLCLCQKVVNSCSTLCPDATVPEAYIRLQARATLGAVLIADGQSADDAVRIC